MSVKSFRNSHPLVLFSYFLAVIILSIIQRNYVLILLTTVGALIVDFFYRRNRFKLDFIYFVIMVTIIMITNPLFVSAGSSILYQNDYFTITLQALIYGGVFGCLISSMIIWFRIMKQCMSDSHFIYLFGSLMPTLGLIVSMSFNIIERLKNQYLKIKEANVHMQASNKFVYYRNVMINLVTYAFESSLDMMASMTSRGYGKGRRTNFHMYSFRRDDLFKLSVIVGLTAVCLWGYFGYYHSFYYYPLVQTLSFKTIDILFIVAYSALITLPLYIGGFKYVQD